MNGITSEKVLTENPDAKPTIDNLVAHFKRYGLSARNGHGKETRYTTYGPFSKDALVEVGRARLGEEAFVQLVSLIGYDEFTEKAREDWTKVREDQEA